MFFLGKWAQGRLLFAQKDTFEIGDIVYCYDNDSRRKIGSASGHTITDIARCTKEEVLKMLLKNEYDYYPAKAYTKKQFDYKLNTSFSVKGTELAESTKMKKSELRQMIQEELIKEGFETVSLYSLSIGDRFQVVEDITIFRRGRISRPDVLSAKEAKGVFFEVVSKTKYEVSCKMSSVVRNNIDRNKIKSSAHHVDLMVFKIDQPVNVKILK